MTWNQEIRRSIESILSMPNDAKIASPFAGELLSNIINDEIYMNKFKVGDRVKCIINDRHEDILKLNVIYYIANVNGVHVSISKNENLNDLIHFGPNFAFNFIRFKLIKEKIEWMI